mgnify:CR=1 FL=1
MSRSARTMHPDVSLTVLKNYLVGNVQIRHVQINNATWCAIDKKDEIILQEAAEILIDQILIEQSSRISFRR